MEVSKCIGNMYSNTAAYNDNNNKQKASDNGVNRVRWNSIYNACATQSEHQFNAREKRN